MAASLETIRLLTIQAKTEGVDAVARQLESIDKAQRGVASSADALRVSNDNVAKSSLSAAKQFDALARSIDPVARAQQQLSRGQVVVTKAFNEGAIGADQAARMLTLLAGRHAEAEKAALKGVESIGEHSAALGLNRLQMMESVHVAKAFADEIVAGQNPMRALAMEGGRIAQIFSLGSGGVGGTLKAFGSMLAPIVLNPLTLTVAAMGAAGVAAYQLSAQQDRLTQSLNGVGRAAGLSVDGLRAAGVSGARMGGISAGQGVDLAGQFAASGGVPGALIPGLVGSTQKYARAFGLDLKDAGKELADAFANPTQGAEKLNERLGFLDGRTKETIRSLQSQGDLLGAQRALWAAYRGELDKTKVSTDLITDAMEKAKGIWGDFSGYLARIASPTTAQKIETLEAQLRAIGPGATSRNPIGEFFFGDKTGERGLVQAQLEEQRRRLAQEQAAAERERMADERMKLSRSVDAATNAAIPELGARQSLADRHGLLSRALGDPEMLEHLGVKADAAKAALERVTIQLANFLTPIEKIAEESTLATRASEAWTFAERAAVAADQARISVLRETGDVARAAASAEAARNRLIDEGNKKASDALKSATDREAMAGMTPYERGRAEIKNRYRDLREQYVPEKGDLAPYAAPVVGSFNRAAQAADALATSLGHAAGAAGGRGASLPFFAQGNPSLAMIMQAEGTTKYGDPYNTSLGYMKSPKPLTSMTMDEALAWGAKVRAAQGLNSSAKGAYQIVNTTQRDAMAALGFKGSDLFTPAAQDAMAGWVLKTQGPGAWEGLKKNGYAIPQPASTAGSTLAGAERKDLGVYDQEKINGPIKAANEELARQRATLEATSAVWGTSTEKMAAVAKQQELINNYSREGVPITEALRQEIERTGEDWGRFAARQEAVSSAQRELQADFDTVRSASRGALSTFLTDLESGKKKSDALRDAMKSFVDSLQSRALDSLTSALFGGSGKAGGGLLGGLFSSIFTTGSHAAGGFVGSASSYASVPLSAFIGAPHFAEGGAVGGARPIIAHDGELVLNVAQQKNIAAAVRAASGAKGGGGAGPAPVINNHYHLTGAISSDDVQRMVQAGSAEAVRYVKRNVMDMANDAQARRF